LFELVGIFFKGWGWRRIAGIVAVFLVLLLVVMGGFASLLISIYRSAVEGDGGHSIAWKAAAASVFGLLVIVILGIVLWIDELRNYWFKVVSVIGMVIATSLLWWRISPLLEMRPALAALVGTGLLVGTISGTFMVFIGSNNRWLGWLLSLSMGFVAISLIAAGGLRIWDRISEERSSPATMDTHAFIHDVRVVLQEDTLSKVYDTEPPKDSSVSWQTRLILESGCLIRIINGTATPKVCRAGSVTGDTPPVSIQVQAVDGPAVFRLQTWEVRP
jgi:hypothetical protein